MQYHWSLCYKLPIKLISKVPNYFVEIDFLPQVKQYHQICVVECTRHGVPAFHQLVLDDVKEGSVGWKIGNYCCGANFSKGTNYLEFMYGKLCMRVK